MQKKVSKLPIVPVSENGDGLQYEVITEYNTDGSPTWQKSALGYIAHWQYRADGVLVRRIYDVNTSLGEGAPTGWVTLAGGGLNLVTDYESDPEGRVLRELGPWHQTVLSENDEQAVNVRSVNFNVYRAGLDEVWSAVGYATGSAPAYGFETVGAVTITKRDKQGRVTDVIEAERECSCGTLKSAESFPQRSWEAWIKNYFDEWGRLLVRRVYHQVPKIGEGKQGEHYGETKYQYNVMGKQVRQISAGGTITRAVYGARGLVTASWIGTDDAGATDSDPSGGGATGNNMVKTVVYEYDNGDFDGNGLLTKETRPVDGSASNNRITEYTYDYRTLLVERKDND